MTLESHLTRGAKDAAHRTTSLRGDAKRAAVLGAASGGGGGDLRIIGWVAITHKNSLDQVLIGQLEKRFACGSVRRILINLHLERREADLLGEFLAQRFWQVCKLLRRVIEM